jgi:hypothetical protein
LPADIAVPCRTRPVIRHFRLACCRGHALLQRGGCGAMEAWSS